MHLRSFALLMRTLPVAALALSVMATGARSQADQPLPNPPEFPFENPLLPGQAELGKFLFWEEQMSSDNTMACGTCHIHEAGGSDPRSFEATSINPGPDGLFGTADDIRGSQGVVAHDVNGNYVGSSVFFPHVQVTGRKAPSAINAVYFNEIFWDGRALGAYTDPQTQVVEIAYMGALESQAMGPPTSDVEMARGGETWTDISNRLVTAKPLALGTNLPQEMADFVALYPTYPDMFEAVYGDPAITSRRIMFAIGNYERTLIADESPMDKFLKGEEMLPPELEVGRELFQGKANCSACHTLPFTADGGFHNIGVRPDAEDVGRMAVTGDPLDMARFKTPNVRNAKLRVPLFHNGSMSSVAELVDFYNMGGLFTGPNTDTSLFPLNLTDTEKADLIHFVEVGLTDPRVAANEFPFTRPTLRSELPSSNVKFGVASANGAAVLPELVTNVPANKGHADFTLGVAKATPNAASLLALAFGAGNGSPFPDPRFPIPMNINVATLLVLTPTVTDASGAGTVKIGIPPNAALTGFTFYGQFFIKDAAALATGGVYGTEGVGVTIF